MSSLFPIHTFFGGWDMSLLDQFSLWGGIQFIYFQSFFCCRRSLDKVWSCFFLFFEASSALSLSNMLRLRQITKRGEGGEQKGTINQCVPSSFSEESSSLAVYNTPDQSNSAPRQMRHFPHSLFKEQGHNSQNGDGKLLVKNVHGNIVMLG